MSALAILSELQRRGVSVRVDGYELVLKPRRKLDGELLARARKHKPEIIHVLANHPALDDCEMRPIVPTRADCGCDGLVCRRCWLCKEHCRCLPKGTCWHCHGEGRCGCTACGKGSAGEPDPCVVCEGTGKLIGRVQ